MARRKSRQPEPDTANPILHSNVPLLEVAESWLLDMIMADQIASRMVVAKLGDRVAIVLPGQVDALLARLRKLGHTPRVEEV
jgi:hypothetical protein